MKDNRKINLIKSYNGHQSGNIYDKNGLSPALCCTDYKAPLKIMEDRGGNSMDKDIIDNNFTEVEKGKYITTDRERESCYAITTHPRSRPLHKKQDNYVLEENNMLKLRETTKKGYKEAKAGDGVELSRSHCTRRRGVCHEDSTGALNTQDGSWGVVNPDYRIRKLTPLECERLQAFPVVTSEVEIWLSDQVRKNVQSVAERWHKNLKLVGNAEKDKLLKNVSFVERNLKQKNQQTKKLVLQNVLINYEAGQIQLYNLKKLKSSARTVEKENLYLHQTVTENFVPLIVGMSTIVEKIIHCGKEELLRNEQWEIHQENGKIVAKLYGKEMMPLVSSVEEDLIMMKNLMKFITSDLSNMKIQDMMLITLYCCVIGVIIGYIPIKTDLSCLEKINLEITTGWTEYGKDGEEISDTQRYKCMGNAVTTSVVTFVINRMFGVSDEE